MSAQKNWLESPTDSGSSPVLISPCCYEAGSWSLCKNQMCTLSPRTRTYSESLSKLLKLSKFLLYDQFLSFAHSKGSSLSLVFPVFWFQHPTPLPLPSRRQQRLPTAWPGLVFMHNYSNSDCGWKGELQCLPDIPLWWSPFGCPSPGAALTSFSQEETAWPSLTPS